MYDEFYFIDIFFVNNFLMNSEHYLKFLKIIQNHDLDNIYQGRQKLLSFYVYLSQFFVGK